MSCPSPLFFPSLLLFSSPYTSSSLLLIPPLLFSLFLRYHIQTQFQNGFNGEGRARKNKDEGYDCRTCMYGCGVSLGMDEMRAHTDICIYRKLDCPNKCGVTNIFYGDLDDHLTNICLNRLILCKRGCREYYPGNKETEHLEEQCYYRLVLCPNHCFLRVRFSDLNFHLNNFCAKRLVLCPLYCHELVKFCDITSTCSLTARSRAVREDCLLLLCLPLLPPLSPSLSPCRPLVSTPCIVAAEFHEGLFETSEQGSADACDPT